MTDIVRIKALMVDVDGVLIDGRPGDGRRWHASIHEDLGVTRAVLQEQFFAPHWDDILVGRADLMEHLAPVLQQFAPHVSPGQLVSYWFERDSRLVVPLVEQLSAARSAGIGVYLATNQEHLRAEYLMKTLGLADHVDRMFYSARVGAKKPDTDFFARVQAAVGLSGDELLLIDDNIPNVEAALKAGWQALHWTRDSSPHLIDARLRLGG